MPLLVLKVYLIPISSYRKQSLNVLESKHIFVIPMSPFLIFYLLWVYTYNKTENLVNNVLEIFYELPPNILPRYL